MDTRLNKRVEELLARIRELEAERDALKAEVEELEEGLSIQQQLSGETAMRADKVKALADAAVKEGLIAERALELAATDKIAGLKRDLKIEKQKVDILLGWIVDDIKGDQFNQLVEWIEARAFWHAVELPAKVVRLERKLFPNDLKAEAHREMKSAAFERHLEKTAAKVADGKDLEPWIMEQSRASLETFLKRFPQYKWLMKKLRPELGF